MNKKSTIFIFKASLFVSLSACGGPGQLLSQTPVDTIEANRPYEKLAACVFERLNHQQGSGVHKADLPTENMIRITLESGSTKFWELTFYRVGANQTRIEIFAAQTMWGPFPIDQAMPEVRACISAQ